MRIFWIRFKDAVKTFFACLVAAGVCFFLMCARGSAFPFLKGERTYYLYSPSSQAVIAKEYSLKDYFRLKGESVVVWTQKPKNVMEEIVKELKATVLFEEEVDGVHSYYCRAHGLFKGVQVNGVFVNLHIVVKENSVAVGTPIIFGGY